MKYVRLLSMVVFALHFAPPLEAATATWDRNPEPEVTGYLLSYGTEPGLHDTIVDVGNVVAHQFFPPAGRRYYLVIQAYDAAGGLSQKSDEVFFDVPATPDQSPVLPPPSDPPSSGTPPSSPGTPPVSPSMDPPVDPSEIPLWGDFDGDQRYEHASYSAATGAWRIWPSTNNFVEISPIMWGVSGDLPVPADYDGDRRTDLAVYRPSNGVWYVLLSSTNMQTYLQLQWGDANDQPFTLDYDFDGKADLVLPRSGRYEILLSGSNYTIGVTVQ